MAWQCPKCGGRAATEAARRCEACNFVEFGQLVVTGATGQKAAANIDTDFGRRSLASVLGEESKYLSTVQFKVARDPLAGQWAITHAAEATNPTCINGTPLGPDPYPIKGGEVVTIGPTLAPMTVTVVFVARP